MARSVVLSRRHANAHLFLNYGRVLFQRPPSLELHGFGSVAHRQRVFRLNKYASANNKRRQR